MLNSHQASVLDHLDEVEPTGLLTLAAHMGVAPSTMSLTVDRLVNFLLTRAGVHLKSEKSVLDPERVRFVLDQLTPEQREDALRGLALLAQASSEAMQKRQKMRTVKRSHA